MELVKNPKIVIIHSLDQIDSASLKRWKPSSPSTELNLPEKEMNQ